ncbi:hypothetical protein ACM42_11535 [Bradyrhizobium sp. CCBAU 25338]|nr:hypothetical protein [Bradyrhizobium sp. CCBAU 25338]
MPGWSFLGATYDAVIVQPFVMQSVGSPVNAQAAGVFNTYVVPVELSWKLGASGFVVKAGLGFGLDDGTVTGANGLGNVANPYWTVQPELIVSYLKDGWNVTAAMYEEFNTPNRITHYTTGNILHADFTATKTIDKWTIGPVAYYIGQVTDDSCPASCAALGGSKLAHVQRYDTWSVGGLVGYDFGPASVSVWATKEVYSKASNAAASPDPSVQPMGTTVLATLSYRIWAPDAPAPTQPKLFHK